MRSKTSAWRRQIWNVNWHTIEMPTCNMPRDCTSQHDVSPAVSEPSQSSNGTVHCHNVMPPQCRISRAFLSSKFWCDCSMPNESPIWSFKYKKNKRRVRKAMNSITRFLLCFSLEARWSFHISIFLAPHQGTGHNTSVE